MKLDFGASFPSGAVPLPPSKSIANRLLIMAALAEVPPPAQSPREPEDIVVLRRLLAANEQSYDVGMAGTAARFFTAFACLRPGFRNITGAPRMLLRPIGPLVDGLRQLGAEINYLGQEGFLPIAIKGGNLPGGEVKLPGDVSSQFITALLLIGPYLEKGLQLRISGELRSAPYVEMTLALMRRAGAEVVEDKASIQVAPGRYTQVPVSIERDWSAAGYFFALVALCRGGEIRLPGLSAKSIQGDAVAMQVFARLGVHCKDAGDGLVLTHNPDTAVPEMLHLNARDTPDLVQTYACVCTGLRIPVSFEGVSSLRIKETDRIGALKAELGKLGVQVHAGQDTLELTAFGAPRDLSIETYNDHRMAMAFAPLAAVYPGLRIAQPEVVSKSFPGFWDALNGLFQPKDLND